MTPPDKSTEVGAVPNEGRHPSRAHDTDTANQSDTDSASGGDRFWRDDGLAASAGVGLPRSFHPLAARQAAEATQQGQHGAPKLCQRRLKFDPLAPVEN